MITNKSYMHFIELLTLLPTSPLFYAVSISTFVSRCHLGVYAPGILACFIHEL